MEAAGNEYLFAEVKWMEAGALLHLGDPQATLRICADLMPRAARAGHQDVAWICRSFNALIQHLEGDLEKARETYEDGRRFARAHNVPWAFIDTQGLALVAMCRGDRGLADRLFAEALAEQPDTYWEGMTESYWFLHQALEGDPEALARVPRLPPPPQTGKPALAGAWYSVAPRVQGLAALDRRDDVAALLPAAEALVEGGFAGHYWSAKTTAGIALGAAGRWEEAERQHRAAIDQADSLSFGLLRPQAREWYARMLRSRNHAVDTDRARALLAEAIRMYEEKGMTAYAERAAAQRGS
jgi:tetratricopeptide (TPR) repeat protein